MTRPPNPYLGRVDALGQEDFSLLKEAVAARDCRERVGFATLDEAAAAWRPDPPCPECGGAPRGDGRASGTGRRRFECPECGRRYLALSGTVFEGSKKDLPTWARFVDLMRWGVPLDGIAELCGISHQTAFEWRHRVFAALDGYQEGLVLRDRVWIDETYVADVDVRHAFGEPRRRGLSRDKICVVVAIDVHKTVVAVVCGHGRPSAKRMEGALLRHLAPGSTVVHDMERSHAGLIRKAGCESEPYRADVRDPGYLEGMEMVNSLCSWIKRYMRHYVGMKPENMQSYLNWYVYLFRVKRQGDEWPETERVLRHLMMTDAHFRTKRDHG